MHTQKKAFSVIHDSKGKIHHHSLVFISDESESEGSKLVAIAFVELVLILHPVKTQGVKERAQRLHHQKHSHRCKDEDEDSNDQDEYIVETVLAVENKKKREICVVINIWRVSEDVTVHLLTPMP